jgi:rod shape-determining protein MreC
MFERLSAAFGFVLQVLSFGRGVIVFVFLTIVSLLMLHGSVGQKQGFADWLFSTVYYPAQVVSASFTQFHDARLENAELKALVGRLSLENAALREAARETGRLRASLAFQEGWSDYPLALAQVVGKNPEGDETTLVINRGVLDSLESGMPVFTPQGLVGRVSKVFRNHAMVQLLADPNLKVSLIALRSRVVGVFNALEDGDWTLTVPAHSDVRDGDTLATSGLGGMFPKGIPVGIAGPLKDGSTEVVRTSTVLPLQKSSLVEEVFVIRKQPDWVVQALVK